jgi:hypothetical protein
LPVCYFIKIICAKVLVNVWFEFIQFAGNKFNMNLKQIEGEALHLSEEERAELAQKLLISLDSPSEKEIAVDWLREAQRRARELDEGTVRPISSDEVRRKAQSLLR